MVEVERLRPVPPKAHRQAVVQYDLSTYYTSPYRISLYLRSIWRALSSPSMDHRHRRRSGNAQRISKLRKAPPWLSSSSSIAALDALGCLSFAAADSSPISRPIEWRRVNIREARKKSDDPRSCCWIRKYESSWTPSSVSLGWRVVH